MSLLLLLAVGAALHSPDCPIDRAVYRLNTGHEYSAGFARQDRRKVYASDLAFWLKTPARTYWFSFGSPNGYGGTYISPDIDPRASSRMSDDEERDATGRVTAGDTMTIEFDAFAADLKPYEMPPQSKDPAPARIFARGLGPALWYEPLSLSGGDETAAQEAMPIGLFEPAGCSGPPPEKKLRRP